MTLFWGRVLLLFLIAATLEVCGDSLSQTAVHHSSGVLALDFVDWGHDNTFCLWIDGEYTDLELRKAPGCVCSLLFRCRAGSREDSISTTAHSSRSGGRFFNPYRRSD